MTGVVAASAGAFIGSYLTFLQAVGPIEHRLTALEEGLRTLMYLLGIPM